MVNRIDMANSTPIHSHSMPTLPALPTSQNRYSSDVAAYANGQTEPAIARSAPSTPFQVPEPPNGSQPSHSSDRKRWLPVTFLTALIPLAAANAIGYSLFQQRSEDQGQRQLSNQSLLAGAKISNVLNQTVQASAAIALNPLVVDTVRDRGKQARAENLNQLSIEQAERQFQDTKLFQPSQDLNDYLKNTAATVKVSDLLITEQHGLTIASTNRPTQAVQRNRVGWQQAKTLKSWTVDSTPDPSTNATKVSVHQAILDPTSNEFLGVVRAGLPETKLAQLADSMQQLGISGSQQVQLLSSNPRRVLTTINAQGSSSTQTMTGGETIANLAIALAKAQQTALSADQIAGLKAQYSLQDLSLIPVSQEVGDSILTASVIHQGKQYSLTTIPHTPWVAIASMDHSEVTAAKHPFLLVFALTFLALAAVGTGAVLYLSRQWSKPLRNLASAADQMAAGNLKAIAQPNGTPETKTLAYALNGLAVKMQRLLQEQAIATEQGRLLTDITRTRTLNEQDVETVFNRALDDARVVLNVDRMVIYRFKSNWSGYISHESVSSAYPRALNSEIEDPCIPQSLIDAYHNDRVVPTSDVFNAGFHPDHLKLMQRLKVKANVVVPILHEGRLFGLLIAHHCTAPHDWQELEISFMRQLAAQLGVTLDRVAFVQNQEMQAERSQLLRDITLQLTQADTSEAVLAQLPLLQIRQMLKSDRVIVYRFDENWQGTITAESVNDKFPRALGAKVYDPCFEKDYVEKYKRGRIQATSNIYEAGLTTCHLNQLEPFAVKANLVAPILQGDNLLGLLIAHHCSAPRVWEQIEIDSFAQVANQVALALDRCELLEQRETAAEQARSLAEEQRQQKEALQRQLTNLLGQVEEVARGDLTVRAEVTTGEIGTVADFFNSIVENLRQIVTNVKDSAIRVSSAIGEDEASIRQLASVALKQAEETTRTLHSIEQMTLSIQEVADNARQAAIVASQAFTTAEVGGVAMDRTVQNILGLREMIGDTAKKMKRLGESSQQISKVVSLIEKIALQTNLLSINAGIEAARAGQEGQGFSVVAEEIGELAAKSGLATGEIETIVNTIQMETVQVIEAMEQSTAKVVEGTRLVEDAKQSLNQILNVSQQIDQLVKSISEATVSQTRTAEVVTSLIQEVVQASQQTSTASNKVSGSLQHTVEIAQELEASVGTFKVETPARR